MKFRHIHEVGHTARHSVALSCLNNQRLVMISLLEPKPKNTRTAGQNRNETLHQNAEIFVDDGGLQVMYVFSFFMLYIFSENCSLSPKRRPTLGCLGKCARSRNARPHKGFMWSKRDMYTLHRLRRTTITIHKESCTVSSLFGGTHLW